MILTVVTVSLIDFTGTAQNVPDPVDRGSSPARNRNLAATLIFQEARKRTGRTFPKQNALARAVCLGQALTGNDILVIT